MERNKTNYYCFDCRSLLKFINGRPAYDVYRCTGCGRQEFLWTKEGKDISKIIEKK